MDMGCVFDGHHGVYIYEMIQELAVQHGWPAKVMKWSDPNTNTEADDDLFDAADEAEQWLNDNVAEPSMRFGWHDGEFFYMPNQWWQED